MLLGIVLLLAVVAAIVIPRFTPGILPGGRSGLTQVSGIVGSEKAEFFRDPAVVEIFAEHGYEVTVSTEGSRRIATSADLESTDFVFPSSAPAAQKIEQDHDVLGSYDPFYSPMAIASFTPIAELLEGEGVTEKSGDDVWSFDVEAFMELVDEDARWSDLEGSDSLYPSSRNILVTSTDIRTSNSAAMYLSLLSYVANGNSVVSEPGADTEVADALAPFFLEQGYSASSSSGPFEDYLSQGMGSKPLVMVYEAQFLGRQMSPSSRGMTDQMTLLRPTPTVLSQHVLLSLTEPGDAVGRLLSEDEGLARLAALHGFRPADGAIFSTVLEENGLPAPPDIIDVVDPPPYERLETMIETIGARYDTPASTDEDPDADAGRKAEDTEGTAA